MLTTTDRPRAAAGPGRSHRLRTGAIGLAALLIVAIAAEPSFAKAAPTARDVRGWLADLSNPLPSRREAAHRRLMGLSRPGLDLLRDAIHDHARELTHDQDLLHDVVIQAFLATEPYKLERIVEGDRVRFPGFMGVQFDNDQLAEDSPYEGVEIRHIIPGLCASKYLEEGDVVLDLHIDKEVRPLRSAAEMMMVIGSLPAGQELDATVLRRGHVMAITMTLGGKPPDIEKTQLQFQAERQTEAEGYWEDHFASLFDPAAPPAPTPPPPPARASAR